ncbi:hypothetical protein PP175_14480 [Aneurinibacillus sp. Ricciae_BoGa-3]|uniref:hypothetical protein n=1 Tax=Aneurinibacillus sp. Ricciae_BoGa-3 TaxID=3022697 RepID=UPI0023404E56|nr:hypothetical protein [Aneurinibacillus sp. Ricciae_BoGa-3]WCK52637.1 hypothetical protein PP175_14480 [Aneurinibacillus sp. Ricciae_BoGa-3]
MQIGLTSQEEQGMVPLPIDIIVQKELSIIGSLGMQASRYTAMLQMLESNILKPGSIVVNGFVHYRTLYIFIEKCFGKVLGPSIVASICYRHR